MIRKLIRRVLRMPPLPQRGTQGIPFKKHGIRREQCSSAALKVTDRLQEAGFTALIVGGAVRDLLLARTPKDFDIATNATPEQVQRVFGRRARIIGRRFRIVHVPFGAEIIEVTTFRGDAHETHLDEETGRILRDNVWGDQEQDARRRDFTVNAMYYDPSKEVIYDFHHGLQDVERRQLVMIGDPERRYREDPVRILRGVRLAAKLGLSIETGTAEPIERMKHLLSDVPTARLFDELTKMLVSGAAAACFDHLDKMRLAGCFLPAFGLAMREPASRKFILDAMTRTDARVAEDKPINPAFQLAAVLWPAVNTRWQLLAASRNSDLQAALDAIEEILHEQRGLIPARLTTTMREIWSLQPRFTQRTGRRPHRLLEHPRFRAAYDFLMVRGAAGEVENELVDWWTDFQTLDAGGQDALQMQLTEPAASVPKKRRRRRKPSEKGAASPVTTHD